MSRFGVGYSSGTLLFASVTLVLIRSVLKRQLSALNHTGSTWEVSAWWLRLIVGRRPLRTLVRMARMFAVVIVAVLLFRFALIPIQVSGLSMYPTYAKIKHGQSLWEAIILDEDEYFTVGDNRHISDLGATWEQYILGKVIF